MLCFIGAAVIYSEFLTPAYDQITVLRGKKQAAEQELAATKAAIASIEELLKQYQSLTDLKDRFSLILPTAENSATVINQLYTMAQAHSIKIESMSLQRIPPPKPVLEKTSVRQDNSTLRISMRLAGDYFNAKDFFENMQRNVRMMDIGSIKVSGGAGQNKDGLRYQVVFDVYYQ